MKDNNKKAPKGYVYIPIAGFNNELCARIHTAIADEFGDGGYTWGGTKGRMYCSKGSVWAFANIVYDNMDIIVSEAHEEQMMSILFGALL